MTRVLVKTRPCGPPPRYGKATAASTRCLWPNSPSPPRHLARALPRRSGEAQNRQPRRSGGDAQKIKKDGRLRRLGPRLRRGARSGKKSHRAPCSASRAPTGGRPTTTSNSRIATLHLTRAPSRARRSEGPTPGGGGGGGGRSPTAPAWFSGDNAAEEDLHREAENASVNTPGFSTKKTLWAKASSGKSI